MSQRYIIAGGTGFIGQHLVKHWLSKGIQVSVISRTIESVRDVFAESVQALTWADIEQYTRAELHSSSLIVNLCGASISDKRWIPAQKEMLLASRLQSTSLLSQLCAAHADKAPMLFNASAVGMYGFSDNTADIFDEDSEPKPDPKHHFLSDTAAQWEKATEIAKAHGVHVINLRFGVVLGKKGGLLKKLTLPYQLGLGGKLGNGMQPMSWIHIDDVAAIIDFLTTHTELHGAVNLAAPQVVTQLAFAKTLAGTLNRPCLLPMPAALLRSIYGEMADELLLRGQAVYPKRLLDAGYQFQYSDLHKALENK